MAIKRANAANILKESEKREAEFKPQALTPEEARAIAITSDPSDSTVQTPKRGRPVVIRKVMDKGAKQISFEEEDDDALWCSSGRGKYSQKDIIRTAVHEFLKKYYNGKMLNEDGDTLVKEFIERTTIK